MTISHNYYIVLIFLSTNLGKNPLDPVPPLVQTGSGTTITFILFFFFILSFLNFQMQGT